MSTPDVDRMVDEYFRHGLSAEEEELLFAQLASDGAAMDRFVELAELESGLVELYGESEGQTRAEERIQGRRTPLPMRRRTPLPRLAKSRRVVRSKPSPAIIYVLPAAAILVAITVALISMDRDQPRRDSRAARTSRPEPSPRLVSEPDPEPEVAHDAAVAPEVATDVERRDMPVALDGTVAEGTVEPPRPTLPPPLAPPIDETVAAAEPVRERDTPDAPRPEPAAAAVRAARVKSVEGTLELSPADTNQWTVVAADAAVASGDQLRTRFARAVVTCESGTAVHIDRFTTMRISSGEGRTLISMVGGELFVATVEGEKHLVIETPQGIVTHRGTRFAVSVKPRGTSVMVLDGSVEARTDVGAAEVGAGHEVHLSRRASRPGTVVKMRDPRQRLAWTGAFPPEKNLDGDLVAYWGFDEGRGNVAYDRSQSGLHGRLLGRPQWVRGRKGIALAFNGTKGQGVDINRAASIGALPQGTIMAWVKPAKSDTGHRAWFSAATNKPDCYFKLLVSANMFELWALKCRVKKHVGGRAPLTEPTGWSHVALAVGEKSTTLFVNGVEAGRLDEPLLFSQTCGTASRMRIGGMTGHPKLTFDGIIDEVRIYRRPLDADEVGQLAGLD